MEIVTSIDDPSLLEKISRQSANHAASTVWWSESAKSLESNIPSLVSALELGIVSLGEVGSFHFHYENMGTINSTHLFGLHELILFSFYWKNRNRYSRVADLGANLGLHSIILEKLGLDTISYEPDPKHFRLLERNLSENGVLTGQANRKAVHTHAGTEQFVRVLNNTTGSHLRGAKADPYGPIENFTVATESIGNIVRSVDLIKMDVEGAEAELICAIPESDFSNVDIILEIGSLENSKKIWEHIASMKEINLFSQKIGWLEARSWRDLPQSHREGSVFLSSKKAMPW